MGISAGRRGTGSDLAVAMIVFSRRGKHMEERLNAEELARNIVSHQLYGLASTAPSGA